MLGSGELGKELVIESKRLGLEVIAIDSYEKAPAMQVADYSRVIDMGDKNILKNVIKEFKPDYVVPEIEALSIEALKELEDEGFNIVPKARTVEITMNRDKIRDLASKDLKIKTAKFDYILEFACASFQAFCKSFFVSTKLCPFPEELIKGLSKSGNPISSAFFSKSSNSKI